MTCQQGADGTRRERMLPAQHEREFAGREHVLDKALELIEGGFDRPGDRRFAHGRHPVVEIGLASQLLVVELELLAGFRMAAGPAAVPAP